MHSTYKRRTDKRGHVPTSRVYKFQCTQQTKGVTFLPRASTNLNALNIQKTDRQKGSRSYLARLQISMHSTYKRGHVPTSRVYKFECTQHTKDGQTKGVTFLPRASTNFNALNIQKGSRSYLARLQI